MGFPINGDLIPTTSGFSNLGVDVDSNSQNAFDITSIRPFNNVHLVSGVFHDPLHGQSGVLRFNQQQGAFQVSVNGGLTFVNLSAGGVDSIGVIGGANLTGHVDLASVASGFIAITDNGGASPIFIAVNTLALSGLWGFPAQGFNGSIVNRLTDFNGTSVQGVVSVVGTSGIVVDIIGQTMTVTPGPSGGFATCHVQAFSAATTWQINHNLNTPHVVVSVWDNSSPAGEITPDKVRIINANRIDVIFNTSQVGKAVVIGCRDIF